jgi:RNA polymerase sigma-70 factor (ECF subfamily)
MNKTNVIQFSSRIAIPLVSFKIKLISPNTNTFQKNCNQLMDSFVLHRKTFHYGFVKEVYRMDHTQELIIQCQSGDKQAFGHLVTPFIQKAFAIAFSILKSKESAEDAVQNSLLEAYKNIMAGKEFRSFQNWFYSLVTSRSLDIIRRYSKERTNTDFVDTIEMVDQTTLPLEAIIEKEEKLGLLEKILELPDTDRVLIILYYYQDLSIREISLIVNMTEGAVKTKLFRARNKLHSLYKSNVLPFKKVGEIN